MDTQPSSAAPQSTSSRRLIFGILIGAAVLVAVVSLILFLKRDTAQTNESSAAAPVQELAPPAPAPQDTDRDTLSDEEEKRLGTDPTKRDTDGDGLTDAAEVRKTKTDPLRARSKDPSKTDLEWAISQ